MDSNLRGNYKELNQSLQSCFVFRLGVDSGFFSEYNNMVLAMLYCLKNGYKFILSSSNSNFSEIGWSDYFIPFCPSTETPFHFTNNLRSDKPLSSKRKIFIKAYQLLTGNHLTQNFWDKFHSRAFEAEKFNIKSLNIEGNTVEASQSIIKITWNFNKQVREEVERITAQLNLPNEYIGLHIRRGDKFKEAKEIPLKVYMKRIFGLSDNKNVFVATDDYSVIEQLMQDYPNIKFYHLTEFNEKGYDQYAFQLKSTVEKKVELIKLFTCIEILSQSIVVVGTYSSNIGMYLGMRIGPQRMFGVDYEKWLIW